jgi:hypothetical protein
MTPVHHRETKTPPLKRTKRLLLKSLAATGALVIVWAVVGLFLYVAPQADEPEHADVLFVLGPPDQRIDYAERLMQQGYAPMLAVSVPVGKNGRYAICAAQHTYRVICFNPDPFTTQGEARALRDLSDRYEWKSADVLAAQYHVTRARVIVRRCFTGDLHMMADRSGLPLISLTNATYSWVHQYIYQTAAFVKVALEPGC